MLSFYFIPKKRLEQSNATRASVAAEGLTEANLYLHHSVQMQTSLATWTIKAENAFVSAFYRLW